MTAVQELFQFLCVLLVIRVVLSWVPSANYDHPPVHLVVRVTSSMLDRSGARFLRSPGWISLR